MRKLFSIFFITLVYISITVAQQAAVEIPFIVQDSNGNTQTLIFGLDPAGTPGIDPALGESELPPFPPGGAFDARFINAAGGQSQLGEGSLKDIRNAPSFPYSGTYNHRIKFQAGDPNWQTQTITVSWNLPSGIITGSTISNTAFGGTNSAPFVGIGSLTITEPVDYDRLNIVVVYSDMVPVELTSFTATVIGNGVQLNWNTATELNNQGFEIERKAEVDWIKIGYVPGFGTTTEPRSYSYIDNNVSKGTYTYRLKQLDFGGGYNYSPEVSVEVDFTPSEYILSQNYPNPFNPSTTIMYQVPKSGNVSIVIYDMLGQEVRTLINDQVTAGAYEVQWDGLNNAGIKMSSGSYIYRMTAGDFVESKEMTLLK